jgi:hypothetical protein
VAAKGSLNAVAEFSAALTLIWWAEKSGGRHCLPNLLGLLAMLLVSTHSDRTLERRYHMTTFIALGAVN